MQIAVIGAGVAGLACAGRLHRAGYSVRVFDKGRSVGGRVATRRVETPQGIAQFDHGAQFFTVRDAAFMEALAELSGKTSETWVGRGAKDGWRVATPGMSSLARAMAIGRDVSVSTKVESIVRDGDAWILIGESGRALGRYGLVVCGIPAEQAAPLLAPVAPHLAKDAAQAVTAPCWSGLLAFATPVRVEEAAIELDAHPVLSWLSRDSTKPGRPEALDCWVAHASPAWTRANVELDPDGAAMVLLEAMRSVLGQLPSPIVLQAHRWRYAKVERTAGSASHWDPDLKLGVCGDWRLGPRVECAWQSGWHLAGAILS